MASVSTEDTILDALKTALEAITTGNGYQTTVAEVIQAPAVLPDTVNRPAICFYPGQISRTPYAMSGKYEASIQVFIWAYVESQPNDWDNIRKLVDDIFKKLDDSSWTYRGWTFLPRVNYYFGGADDMLAIAQIECVIMYHHDFGSP